MSPERWQQIEQLYHGALMLAEGERPAFLAVACATDDELRREVDSLLASHQQAGSFIESSPDDVVAGMVAEEQARSVSGRTLGHYQIKSMLGAGGMGEVYRARDTRLDRDVAVKILPEHLADHPDALKRFEREAKAVAALSHPNILSIFDFGTEDGMSYAVMELLEGGTLRDRLKRSPLDWREVVKIAIAIAEGLSAAHAKGIIHRDLKPENIFVTTGGQLKILDFGIARVKRVVSPDAETLMEIATTRRGVLMGTLGYMSPEQVRGETADAPSDIFSLGCVLFEMASGHSPFARATGAEVIAAILREEPSAFPQAEETIPAEMERVIRRCLEKRPDERYQSAIDLALDLKAILNERSMPAAARARRTARPAAWLAAGLAVLLLAVSAYLIGGRGERAATPVNPAPPASNRVEVMTYCLELESDGTAPARVTGSEPLDAERAFRFHFTPRHRGYLYIIGAGEHNVPTTFLTAQPAAATGVTTNLVEAAAEYSFPAGAGNGIALGHYGITTTFTIIFSPAALTKLEFLSGRSNRKLTAEEQRDLASLWRQFGNPSPELIPQTDGAQPRIAVTVAPEHVNNQPIIFDIPLKRR